MAQPSSSARGASTRSPARATRHLHHWQNELQQQQQSQPAVELPPSPRESIVRAGEHYSPSEARVYDLAAAAARVLALRRPERVSPGRDRALSPRSPSGRSNSGRTPPRTPPTAAENTALSPRAEGARRQPVSPARSHGGSAASAYVPAVTTGSDDRDGDEREQQQRPGQLQQQQQQQHRDLQRAGPWSTSTHAAPPASMVAATSRGPASSGNAAADRPGPARRQQSGRPASVAATTGNPGAHVDSPPSVAAAAAWRAQLRQSGPPAVLTAATGAGGADHAALNQIRPQAHAGMAEVAPRTRRSHQRPTAAQAPQPFMVPIQPPEVRNRVEY
jgi:hypothetical protein